MPESSERTAHQANAPTPVPVRSSVLLRIHVTALLLFVLTAVVLALLFYDRAYDDAYITFRYARNLSQGLGFCYNPGVPSLGTTTPLLTLLLALLGLAGFPVAAAGSVLTCTAMLLLALTLYAIHASGGRAVAGLLAGLLVLINYRFVLTIGGESVLLCFLVAAACYFSEIRGRTKTAAVFVALAALTRGEGVLAAPVLLAALYWRRRRLPWREAAIILSIIGAWLLSAWVMTGNPLPSTLAAKIAQGRSGLFMGFWGKFRIWTRWTLQANCLWIPYIALTIPGAVALFRRRRERAVLALTGLLIWVALFVLSYTALGVSGYHWYGIPIILAIHTAVVLALPEDDRLAAVVWPSRARRPQRPTVSVYQRFGIVAATALIIAFLAGEGLAIQKYYHSKYFHWTLYPLAAEILNQRTDDDDTVAYLEIGHFGYYYHGKTLDLLGLTGDIDVSQIARGNLIWGFLKMRPDYYLNMNSFNFMTEHLVEEAWFRQSYELEDTIFHPDHPNIKLQVFRKLDGACLPPPMAIDIRQWKGDRHFSGSSGARSIGQDFVCDFDGMMRIDIKSARENGFSESGGALFRLREGGPEGDELFQTMLPADWPYGPEKVIAVRLKKKMASLGRRYYFSIEAASGEGPLPVILASGRDEYGGGTLYSDGKPVKGDLVFRVWYEDMP